MSGRNEPIPAMRTLSLFALLAFAVSPAIAADPAAPAATVPAGELPAVSHWVYLSELPESADLLKSAAANGLTVKRLDRTSDKVVITYVYSDGLVASVGYALLSSAGNADRVAARAEPVRTERTERTVRVVDDSEVIYVPRRTRYIYRDPFDDFWLPLTLGVGIGWITSGHSHGGWHGHGRSHRGWRH